MRGNDGRQGCDTGLAEMAPYAWLITFFRAIRPIMPRIGGTRLGSALGTSLKHSLCPELLERQVDRPLSRGPGAVEDTARDGEEFAGF